ncbi:MAG: DUF6290 family protein [Coriobacteriales bacterium]|jgi:hypothetical protein|nr:DUF6290 family protein [Coriobacteriales bacterium]
MATKDVTKGIRFTDPELTLINEYASFTGESFSSIVRKATLGMIEDFYDELDLKEAIANDSGEYYTVAEMRKLVNEK